METHEKAWCYPENPGKINGWTIWHHACRNEFETLVNGIAMGSPGREMKGNGWMKKEQVFVVVLVVLGLAGIFYWYTGGTSGSRHTPGSDGSVTRQVTETVTDRVTDPGKTGAVAGGIDWNDYTPGMTRAKHQEKNIFLYFYAQWCTYCTKLKQTTFLDKKVQSYLEDHFISISVDTDKNQTLSRNWQVTGLPTMWFLTPEGDRISSLPGYVDGPQLLKILRYIHTRSYHTMSFEEFVRQ
jgi:thioredoxin-related protein